MRISYGESEIVQDSNLLHEAIQITCTSTGDIARNMGSIDDYGNPIEDWQIISSGILMAINGHEEHPGNITGPIIATPVRFVATLPTHPDVVQGDRIIFSGTTYHVDNVNIPVSINVATTAYLTLP